MAASSGSEGIRPFACCSGICRPDRSRDARHSPVHAQLCRASRGASLDRRQRRPLTSPVAASCEISASLRRAIGNAARQEVSPSYRVRESRCGWSAGRAGHGNRASPWHRWRASRVEPDEQGDQREPELGRQGSSPPGSARRPACERLDDPGPRDEQGGPDQKPISRTRCAGSSCRSEAASLECPRRTTLPPRPGARRCRRSSAPCSKRGRRRGGRHGTGQEEGGHHRCAQPDQRKQRATMSAGAF